jgi:hypothetical protein
MVASPAMGCWVEFCAFGRRAAAPQQNATLALRTLFCGQRRNMNKKRIRFFYRKTLQLFIQ